MQGEFLMLDSDGLVALYSLGLFTEPLRFSERSCGNDRIGGWQGRLQYGNGDGGGRHHEVGSCAGSRRVGCGAVDFDLGDIAVVTIARIPGNADVAVACACRGCQGQLMLFDGVSILLSNTGQFGGEVNPGCFIAGTLEFYAIQPVNKLFRRFITSSQPRIGSKLHGSDCGSLIEDDFVEPVTLLKHIVRFRIAKSTQIIVK